MLCRVLMQQAQEKNTTGTFFPALLWWTVILLALWPGWLCYHHAFTFSISYIIQAEWLLGKTSVTGGFPAVGFYPSSFPCMHQFSQISKGPHLWLISFTDVSENPNFVRQATQIKKSLNSLWLERKYKLMSGHSTQGHPFSVLCLSDVWIA